MLTEYTRQDESCRRIVLLGKTGVGKSAVGNTIFNEKVFESIRKSSSVTLKGEKKKADVNGQMVSVVDTPGLFDTRQPNEEVMREIAKCISYLAPGPHIFLVVIRADVRFTEEEQETVKLIQEWFGKEASRYTMVLFTHVGVLEADGAKIEDFMKDDPHLLPFILQCGGEYHVFNNRREDPSQVRELLKKINTMVRTNEGHYTTEMFEAVEKAIEEKKMMIMLATPNISDDEARSRAEEDNKFITTFVDCVVAAAEAGGALTGWIGAALAASVVALVGGVVSIPVAAIGGVAKVVKNTCSIQ